MKRKRTVAVCFIMILMLSVGHAANSFAEAVWGNDDQLHRNIEETGKYLMKTIDTPSFGSVGGDWVIMGLARSELELPFGFIDSYYQNVERALKEKDGNLTRNKYSEYSRLILVLTSLGRDPTDVAGYNLLAKLSDLELLKKQGINGPIYALLALDSLDYSVPQQAEARLQTTRELLIASILEGELPGGGFSLSGPMADPDITASALQALSNYDSRSDVRSAIDRALSFLSSVQTSKGGFGGWTTGEMENTESIGQVILALTSLGIDPSKDSRFIKTGTDGNKYSPIDALMSFRLEDGSFSHIQEAGPDLMATEQALLALVSYQRLRGAQAPLFSMKDAFIPSAIDGSDYEYKVLLNGRYLDFDQPPINRNSRILVPMRAIFEALGADVEWDNDLRRAIANLNNHRVQLKVGSDTAYINETPVLLDVPAIIEGGRTLVPIRFVSESLDAEVTWDGQTNTAVIIKK